jgi:hypothetical protein
MTKPYSLIQYSKSSHKIISDLVQPLAHGLFGLAANLIAKLTVMAENGSKKKWASPAMARSRLVKFWASLAMARSRPQKLWASPAMARSRPQKIWASPTSY